MARETTNDRRVREAAERKARNAEAEQRRRDKINDRRAQNATRDLERAGYDVVATRRRGR